MTRNRGDSLGIWQMDTYWSDRPGWQQLHYADVEKCRAFREHELPETEIHQETYAFLLSKHYVLKTDTGYKLNVVWADNFTTLEQVKSLIPSLVDAYKPVVVNLYEKLLEIDMRNKPKHIEPQIDYMAKLHATGGTLVPYILKRLIDLNKLTAPTGEQKKTVTTLMGNIYSK
jgi:hypothetical protein